MLEQMEPAPPDPIFGLTEAFKADTRPTKVNLGVGVYCDDNGRTPIPEAVREAEGRIVRSSDSKSYLPIEGSSGFSGCVQDLLLGAEHPLRSAGRARTLQTPGGTGALRIGADLLHAAYPAARVWLSRPTWANHRGIFAAAGFKLVEYPYLDPSGTEIAAAAMLESLDAVPSGDIVLLHACCHNPSGQDPDEGLWRAVAESARRNGWLPFIDFAYQGFGEGLEKDAAGLRAMLDCAPELLVASSFSKNMGLYCERVGALTLAVPDERTAENVFSRARRAVRTSYSNPPAHGGAIVTTVWRDSDLRELWLRELGSLVERMQRLRRELAERLRQSGVERDVSFLERQRGMFSLTGLDDNQVAWLRSERAIYVVKGGRINIAGLNAGNLDYVADAFAELWRGR